MAVPFQHARAIASMGYAHANNRSEVSWEITPAKLLAKKNTTDNSIRFG